MESPEIFLETVRRKKEESPVAFQDLGRVIPVERTFVFRKEDFLDRVKDAVRPFIELLAGKRFYVRLERPGMKGRIVSPEAERAVDAFIEKELAGEGKTCQIDFDHPDAVVVLETIGDRCGVGMLTREQMTRYPFVRVN